MKYNRQQKYNFGSILKTSILVGLMCLCMILSYSFLKTRQRNTNILNDIEMQKAQISDLESLSRSNKEMIKNLRHNIENNKQSLRKLSENLSSLNKNVESEKAYENVKQMHKELKERYETLSKQINEEQQAEQQKREQAKESRKTRIQELKNEIDKLHDGIADLKNNSNISGIKMNEVIDH